MARRLRFRPRLRDTVAATMRTLASYGDIPPALQAAHGRASHSDTGTRSMGREAPGVDIDRAHRKHPSLEATEREIQKSILDYLRAHPKVAWAHRFNRGMVRSEYNGRESFTQFNTCKGFSDIHFLLKGGRAGYCEVKRPGGKLTDDQAAFLKDCTAGGALAFMATSAQDVANALK